MSARQIVEDEDFKAWFDGSKAVDSGGRPLKLYHGTTANFDQFDPRQGIGGANWFTADPDAASMYAYGDGARLHPVYLKMENPLRVHADDRKGTSYWARTARRRGYDGLMVTSDDFPGVAYAVFRPENIRSAVGAQLAEAKRGPDMKTLKKHKVSLTDDERAQVMKAGAVWHHGPGGAESPAVWKSVVNGTTWYVCNTHRAMASKPTLRGAISAFKFIETTG